MILVLAILGIAALAWFRVGTPEVEIEALQPGIGRKASPVTIRVAEPSRGLTAVRVEVAQDGQATVVEERTYDEGPRPFWAFWGPRVASDELEVAIGAETVEGLKEGEATIRVLAEPAGTPLRKGKPALAEATLPVRLRPPALSVRSSQHYVAQGGSGVVVYHAGEGALAEGGRDGVRSGDHFFAGHPLPGGQAGDRFALFGVPWDLDDPSRIRLVAADPIGNEAEVAFVDQWFPRPPRAATIELSDAFLEKVVSEVMSQVPELADRGNLIDNYVQINDGLRKANRERQRQLASRSRGEFLWREPFAQLAGGQVMSAFADLRTYLYQGEAADQQTHLGFDLATTRQDGVPASNRGVVALAEYFGIYGNTVVLDHGYGLMSLYAHLSSIEVEEGQEIELGQILGRTGATGLAGGDHLHFTTMIGGLEVNPVEWWDPKWIADRVKPKLGAALPYAP
ncbi:MAG TPA: M23 family metallopeptidase [Thermoanaerobaculia bacterium]|nr:M23 family metallopeptidase [Thermoanaerobaculia bacterium]